MYVYTQLDKLNVLRPELFLFPPGVTLQWPWLPF